MTYPPLKTCRPVYENSPWKYQSIEIAGLPNLTIASRRRRWSSSPTVAKISIIRMELMFSRKYSTGNSLVETQSEPFQNQGKDPVRPSLPDASFLHGLADAADMVTLSCYRTALAIDEKIKPGYSFDPVTEADRRTEEVLRDLIISAFPGHSIFGEEFGAVGDSTIQWIIDPIVGTRPYLCGLPVWGTLIGLAIDGVSKMGLMTQPVTGERFWSVGDGSWTQWRGVQRALVTKQNRDLSQAIFHTNSPDRYVCHGDIAFDGLRRRTLMTRYGGECYAFAMLAAGQIDLCLELSLQAYDIAALIPIIEGAGGPVTNLSGERVDLGGHVLASANPWLHDQALKVLNAG